MSARNSCGAALNEKVQIHPDGSKEHWRDVVNYVGYYRVSDLGRVKTLPRTVKRWRGTALTKTRITTGFPNKRGIGYPMVCLCVDGKENFQYVHRLVLEAFIGPCPLGMQGCHKNGVRTDNRLTNLRWDTQSANEIDKRSYGRDNRGQRHYASHLTDDQARKVLELHAAGEHTRKQLAGMFHTTIGVIKGIVCRTSYKHL